MSYVSGAVCFKLDQDRSPNPVLRVLPGGHRPAFSEGLVSLRPTLRARALRLTKDPHEADDLVSDTLLRALQFETTFERGSNLKAWAYQVMFSIFITNFRRAKKDKHALASLTTDPCAWPNQDPPPSMATLSPALERRVAGLPKHFRDVLELVDIHSWSYKDAAADLGIPVGTVMSRLFRARKLLASQLQERRAG